MANSTVDGDPAIFHFVMIKPTHYDDDGYPIQWLRSAIPSNTLACLNALAEDAKRREVLGTGVDIRLHTFDETNRRVRPDQIIRMIRRAGGRALIGLVGVQSNQFPRAVDLAKPFLDAGLPVCIGGFHISGCIAMLPELPADIKAAQELGISFFAGEAEERRLDEVLRDAFNGKLKPLYNYMDDLPALAGEPPPFLPRKHVSRTVGHAVEHRSRPRLSLSVLVLHHHQRAGAQEPHPLGRRSGKDRARELRGRDQAVLHHRRQFRPQQGLGAAVRPHDPDAARRGDEYRLHHPGRYALPQDSGLHREGDQGRRAARVHRAGEHQPRQPDRRQEAAEQDHRIPRDAADVAQPRRHHLCRLHPRLSRRHQGIDPARYRDHQARIADRYSGILLPDAVARIGGPQGSLRQGHLDGPGHEQVRPQPPRLASRQDVGRRLGRGLSRGLAGVLHAGTHHTRSCAAPAPARSAGRARRCRPSCGST